MAIPLEAFTASVPPPRSISQRMTLEDYLAYEDGSETYYELVDGVLVEMGAESTINTLIAMYLAFALQSLGIPPRQFGIKQKIQVDSHSVSARDPDLIVHSEASLQAILGRTEAILKLHEPNPWLVIEVVSRGSEDSDNYQRDYVQKSNEYAARGIPEYWIIDPVRAWINVGILTAGRYEFQKFQGDRTITSPTFPNLTLTAEQILTAGG